MKLPIFLSKNLRREMVSEGTLTFFSVCGGLWLLTEVLTFFLGDAMKWAQNNLWAFSLYIGGALLITLAKVWKKSKARLSVRERLEKTDTSIEIKVDDIFNLRGDFIIATNTTFDTIISNGRVSEDSVQGQFTKRYYENNIEYLNHDITKALKEHTPVQSGRGKRRCYEFGTVAKVMPKGQAVYLVAIDELNKEGGSSSSLENVRQSLTRLWQYIGNQSSPGHLIIPVIGTKSAGIQVPRDVMITEIIT